MSWQDSDTPYHHLFTMRTAENRWELCEPVWIRFLSIKVGTGSAS